MEAVNERELVERCRQGDDTAFQELVDRYKDLVFALIARATQDRSRADDLAQEVFLRVHRGLPYFRGEARLSTWIYRIVANVCAQQSSVLRHWTKSHVLPVGVSLNWLIAHCPRPPPEGTQTRPTSHSSLDWHPSPLPDCRSGFSSIE